MSDGRGRVFYGWYIVAACFVINFIIFGISVNTFTVYVKPIETDLGWTRGQISAAMMLAPLAMGVSAPFIGRLIDRIGARQVMAMGAAIIGVGSMLLARSQTLPYFYTVYTIAGIGQAAATLIPISFVVSNWFQAKRGSALGIAMTGTGLGAMVMVPVTTQIVLHWGWRTSYFIMGCIILLMVPVDLLFIKTRPSDMGLVANGTQTREDVPVEIDGLTVSRAVKTKAFWLVGAMMVLFGLVAMGVGVHLMPYLTDVGHSQTRASLIISIISGMTVAGKIGIGSIADRWGIRQAVALTSAMIFVGILILMRAEILVVAGVFALIYGFAIGAPLLINPALTAECMGLKHFGAIFGILSLLNTVGVAAGAFISGRIHDLTGSYMSAFTLFVILIALAGVCGYMAPRSQPQT